MKGLKRISTIIGLALTGAFLALPAAAQVSAGIEPIASATGLGTADIRVIVGRIIYVALGLLGTVLLVIIVYAGFLWMTAGGNDEQIIKAKQYIKNAVIGLVIILASYAITYFVITRLMGVRDSNQAGGPGFEGGIISTFGDYGTSSLGEGIVQSHYPAPGATDVARNTKIIITFKLPVDPASIIANGALKDRGDGKASVYTGALNLAAVRVLETSNLATGGAFATSSDKLVGNIAAYTADNKTYVFAPSQNLGSPSVNVSYTVALSSAIVFPNGGGSVFTGNFGGGYHWEFQTGTVIDNTPPRIVSIMPPPSSTVARNVVIEITFNEGVDPTSATGVYTATNTAFSNVTVNANGRVEGTWEPSNQYKTIGFKSNILGGTNSCGDAVYVLPGGALVTVSALAATVGDAPPLASFYPPDGITDLVGNSLDGNGNGVADGQPADNLGWQFNTTNALDLTPPRIDSTSPGPETGNADLSAPVTMTFSKPMSISTLTNQNLVFESLPKLPLWYFGGGENLGSDGAPVQSMSDAVARTRATLTHERLAPTVGKCSDGVRKGSNCAVDVDCPAGLCAKQAFSYYPKATSGVTDIYQNCFLPARGEGPACGDDPTHPYCCSSAGVDIPCRTECIVNPAGGRLFCDETK